MRFFLPVALVTILTVWLPGCGSTLLLRVHTVEAETSSHGGIRIAPDSAGLSPVAGVRFFFYPYVRDSVIHPVPERNFVTDARGRAEYLETLSPIGDKMGALVALKAGYAIDTVIFPFGYNDTIDIVVRMRPR